MSTNFKDIYQGTSCWGCCMVLCKTNDKNIHVFIRRDHVFSFKYGILSNEKTIVGNMNEKMLTQG